MDDHETDCTIASDVEIIEEFAGVTDNAARSDRVSIDLTLDRSDHEAIDLVDIDRSNVEGIDLTGIDRSRHYTIDLTSNEAVGTRNTNTVPVVVDLYSSSDDGDTKKISPARALAQCHYIGVGAESIKKNNKPMQDSPNRTPRKDPTLKSGSAVNNSLKKKSPDQLPATATTLVDLSSQQNNTSKTFKFQKRTSIVDLYNSSDDDTVDLVTKKPPYQNEAPCRSAKASVGAIAGSPKKASKIIQSSPHRSIQKDWTPKNGSPVSYTTKKRLHNSSVTIAELFNLSGQRNDALKPTKWQEPNSVVDLCISSDDDTLDLVTKKPSDQNVTSHRSVKASVGAAESPKKKTNKIIQASPVRSPRKDLPSKNGSFVTNKSQEKRSYDRPVAAAGQRNNRLNPSKLQYLKSVVDLKRCSVEETDEIATKQLPARILVPSRSTDNGAGVAGKSLKKTCQPSPHRTPRKDSMPSQTKRSEDISIEKASFADSQGQRTDRMKTTKLQKHQDIPCDDTVELPEQQSVPNNKIMETPVMMKRGSLSLVQSHTDTRPLKTLTGSGVIRPNIKTLKEEYTESSLSHQIVAETNTNEAANNRKKDCINTLRFNAKKGSIDCTNKSVAAKPSPSCDHVNHPILKRKNPIRNATKKAPPPLSPETATGQSLDNDNMSDSDEYKLSNSQSSTSLSIELHRKQHCNDVAPARLSLRPRVDGKVISKEAQPIVSDIALATNIETDPAKIDILDIDAKSVLSDSIKHQNETEQEVLLTINARPNRISKDTARARLVQERVKKRQRTDVNKSVDFQFPRTTRVLGVDVTNTSCRDPSMSPEQSDDSENNEDNSFQGNTSEESILQVNTELNNCDGTVAFTVNWKNVPSNSNYLHYNMIDDMIAKKTNEQKDHCTRTATIGNVPMVLGGESRFFAARFAGQHCDSVQWVPSIDPYSRQTQRKYFSTYLPLYTD